MTTGKNAGVTYRAQQGSRAAEWFELKGNTSISWQLTAHELIAAANLCYKRFTTTMDRAEQRKRKVQYYPEFGIAPLLMLYAFALEALLKSLLIAQGQKAVIAGKLAPGFKTHDLAQLCKQAKVKLETAHEERLVEHMTRAVQFGRYPVSSRENVKRGLMFSFPDDHPSIHRLLKRIQDSVYSLEPFIHMRRIDLKVLGVRLIPVAAGRRRR
jgi:hypothetical protein